MIGLADLKAWLAITSTSDDALLATLVTEVSRAVLTYLDRPSILPATVSETRDGGGESAVALRHWPVLALSSCLIDGRAILPAPPLVVGAAAGPDYVLEPAEPQPPGRMQHLALRGFRFTRGVQNVALTYTAGYRMTGEPAQVPAAAPYTLTAAQPYGLWASDAGVAYAGGGALTAVAGTPAAGQYAVVAGVYSFSAADAAAGLALSYGYVPADVAAACRDWVADRYAYRGRIGQRSKSIGGQETTSFAVTDMPAFVATALQPYRRVVAR
jgi:hypothetical protein